MRGCDLFCESEYAIRKAKCGVKLARPQRVKEITKYRYYKDQSIPHYVVENILGDICECGNEKFFEKIGY